MPDEDTVYTALKQISDPEVGVNIVDMGLIYSLELEDNKVGVYMTLTSPACPAGPQILGQIDSTLRELEGVESVARQRQSRQRRTAERWLNGSKWVQWGS